MPEVAKKLRSRRSLGGKKSFEMFAHGCLQKQLLDNLRLLIDVPEGGDSICHTMQTEALSIVKKDLLC